MSCIAGVLNLDGAPVDREMLERMTAAMKNRAPDDCGVWVAGNVGFGHAMLRISPESENEHQPCTLDGEVWVTADARIDGRSELIAQLRSVGRQVHPGAPDVELILHAYHTYGESFLEHVIGDFAIALWDGRDRKLICARDHFGLRPFFYVKKDRLLLFASDIDALHIHPAASRRLDESYVADFLMIGSAAEAEASIFSDIRRLPAASTLTISNGKCYVKPYWKLMVNDEVRYKNDSDYVDAFRELFFKVVGDRLRTNHVAAEMSGGLDSTSIAAAASAVNKKADCVVTAHTTTCHRLFPDDQEKFYAGMVASHLGIPVFYHAIEDFGLFEQFDSPQLRTAEPISNPNFFGYYEKLRQINNMGARVLLTGQGGDAVLAGSSSYYKNLLYGGRWVKLLAEARNHLKFTGTLAGMRLRSAILPFLIKRESWQPPFPTWISADFAARNNLEERWNLFWREWNGPADAYHQLRRSWLSRMFATYEALKMPVVIRHPFYDVRLVRFLLGLPNYLTYEKVIMRKAMHKTLPDPVCVRPKSAAVGDIRRAQLSSNDSQSRVRSNLASVSEVFVDKRRYVAAFENYLSGEGEESTWSSGIMVTPVALNYWLQYHWSNK